MVNELRHFGIKGQKWGVRRFQNEDGTLTEAGKKRYGEEVYIKDRGDGVAEYAYINRNEKYRKDSAKIDRMANKKYRTANGAMAKTAAAAIAGSFAGLIASKKAYEYTGNLVRKINNPKLNRFYSKHGDVVRIGMDIVGSATVSKLASTITSKKAISNMQSRNSDINYARSVRDNRENANQKLVEQYANLYNEQFKKKG